MNLRNLIIYSVLVIILLGFLFFGYTIRNMANEKERIKAMTDFLPSIPLRKLDGSILLTDSFRTTSELLVLNYFNPECDHCQNMVQDMFQESTLLKDVNWLMVTSASRNKTIRFADSMNLIHLPKVIVLNDSAFNFSRAFGTVSVPSFYVYKKGKLIRKNSGECSISYLLQQ